MNLPRKDSGPSIGSRAWWLAALALALVLVAAALPVLPFSVAAQDPTAQGVARGKRLILKDGSYQMVRDWVLQPDPTGKSDARVRYYSVERSRYEELPASLVDFDATHAAEQAQSGRDAALQEEIASGRSEQLAGEVDVDSSLEIAPGLFLPEEAGLWVLVPDALTPQGSLLLPLTQAGAESKLDKGRLLTQILVPIPVIPGRHRIQLAGKQAVLRISNPSPEFYLRTEDRREPEIELIQVKVKGNKREVEVVQTYITGEAYEKRDTVSVQRWPVARGVFRLTLSRSLQPGEYVLAEILPGEGMNLYVWDFGLDPSAATGPTRK